MEGHVQHEPNIAELQAAIIEVLKSRPNQSCKLENLSVEVRRFLHMHLKAQAKHSFEANLNRALGHLKRAKIVEIYVAKNRRVRLSKVYEERWKKVLVRRRSHEGISLVKQTDLFPIDYEDTPVENQRDDRSNQEQPREENFPNEANLIRGPRRLELPPLYPTPTEAVQLDTTVSPATLPPHLDEDEKRLLNVLLGANNNFSSFFATGVGDSRDSCTALTDLELRLSAREDCAAECNSDVLEIMFEGLPSDVIVRVTKSSNGEFLIIAASLPFNPEAALKLLLLSAGVSWRCIPGIEERGGLWHYSFRSVAASLGAEISEQLAAIDAFVAELRQVLAVLQALH